jgi:hypothetical protein
VICVSLALLSRRHDSCLVHFSSNKKKRLSVLLMKRPPSPKQSSCSRVKPLKKIKSRACFGVSSLVCFTLEIAPTQLIDTHSLTARPTQVSLCTCCVKKNHLVSSCANPIKAMFLSIDPIPNLRNLSSARPKRSHATASPFT